MKKHVWIIEIKYKHQDWTGYDMSSTREEGRAIIRHYKRIEKENYLSGMKVKYRLVKYVAER